MSENRSDNIKAGLRHAKAHGRLPGRPVRVSDARIRAVAHLSATIAAAKVGLSRSQFILRRRKIEESDATKEQ